MISPYLRVGFIARPHGIKGAVKLDPLTEDVNRFSAMKEGFLELHGKITPVQLSLVGAKPGAVLLKINGVETVEEAEKLRGGYILVDRQHAVKLPDYTYFVADLIGLQVFDTEGTSYGKLTAVLETGANDVYEIDGGKLLVPALKKVLEKVDIPCGKLLLKAAVLREVGVFAD